MKKLNNLLRILPLSLLIVGGANAQSIPTLELTRNNPPTNFGAGVSTVPMEAIFQNDNINNSTFSTNTPQVSVTVSFRNQQFTGLNYGSATAVPDGTGGFFSTQQTTGLVFGAGPSLANDPIVFGAAPYNRYNIIGEYGGNGGPVNNMFTSNPTAAGANLGTGFSVKDASNTKLNAGFEIFTTAQALFGSANPVGSRVYFGDIVIRFSSPQKNPVIHIAGLGGSYRYQKLGFINIPANYLSTFFSTELELDNTGITSTLLSGNSYVQLSGNNILNNNDANPNGGSIFAPDEAPFNNAGAATGSVRLNGTVQEVVYRVYLQSGTASQFAWSAPASAIEGATRDPFTGDIWYVSASLDKPTQQVSGNVFIDRDGLSDNNINKSAGVDNPKTNIGGTLYANLLNAGGLVVASTPVSSDGSYLFDAVPLGTYSVQLTTNASAGTYASPATAPATMLPSGWKNTGEFVGNTAGSDGTVNGKSSSVVVSSSDIKAEVNFGIERLPESVNFTILIPNPPINTVVTFDGSSPYFLTPLAGSDPEDLPTTTLLTGRTVRIDSLPSNSQLLYNGLPITLGQTITNYNISLLQIKFTQSIPSNGKTAFKYSFIDAAGFADPTPATYTIIPNNGSLFFSLTDFTVSKDNCVANLNWKTSSEINSEKFEVEVSADINATFATKGTIAASTNSSITKNYQFNFSMETGVQYFFRLKMINKDGTFTYSEIRKLSCTDLKTQLAIAPNPVIDMFNITGMEKGKNTILIYSNDGKLIKSQVTGTTTYNVDISNFSAGLYMVRILNENGSNTTKRIVKK